MYMDVVDDHPIETTKTVQREEGPRRPAAGCAATRLRVERVLADDQAMARFHRSTESLIRAPRGALEARELVQDVLSDTWRGKLRWEEAKVPLEVHVIRKVQQRASRARRKQEGLADVDALAAAERAQLDQGDEVHATAEDRQSAAAQLAQILPALHGASDPDVALILGCYEREIVERAEVIAASGLSAKRYLNARRRLTRLARAACAGNRGNMSEVLALMMAATQRRAKPANENGGDVRKLAG